MFDPIQEFSHLGTGQHNKLMCPECNGGQSRERSMSVNKDFTGRVQWHCWRAACGSEGSQFVGGGEFEQSRSVEEAPKLRPYTSAVYPIEDWCQQQFFRNYGLLNPDIMWARENGKNRYILPIRKYDGTIRGYTSRRPWDALPEDNSPKSITYWNEPGPLLSWYTYVDPIYGPGGRTLIVEDQLSAMRAAEHLKITTCAILGTGLNQEKVQELQQHTKHLIIALDADATGNAFALARKWGRAFDSCKVLVLKQDIKDMPLSDLTSLNL